MLYDPATVEACAKVAEGTAPIARGNFFKARREQTAKIASAIRSLTAGREIQSSDGGAKVASSAVLASEEDQRSGLHGVMPVGTIAASSGNTDAGPSEAIHAHQPSMPKYEYQKDAGEGGSVSYRDPVVRQDCAPAGTVSEEELAEHLFIFDYPRSTFKEEKSFMRHYSLTWPPTTITKYYERARALLSQFDVRRK